MEVVGTVMSVAQTLFAALQSLELKEFLSAFGYESELEDLQRTVTIIKAVFQDAERKQTLSAVEQQLIEDLKDAVYDADDLLDEFVTLAEQNKLLKADGSVSKKMRSFLSRTNPFGVAYKMSKGVKEIKRKLDAIVDNKRFSFQLDHEPIRKRRPETCSYVDEGEIIGRDEDLEKIVNMLLDPDVEQDVSFLTIVGIGGLGKTALAQLVYNDPRITSAFLVRKWTCVSDEEQAELNVKEILSKIVGRNQEGCTTDEVQIQLRELLAHKRHLLVLDDVWTEIRYQWHQLEKYLIGGQKGSWIMVTTRSQRTATIIGDSRMYKLEGLSQEYSWQLFERTAFGISESYPPQDLVKIGRGIVDGCARVPLAIRVVGSLLFGQDKQRWQSVHDIGLANIRANENDIMSILKLSYYHLLSPLKSCFSYCALFPKDYEIKRERLINLWMAQGYIVPLDEGQSIEDAGEEYFMILLRRCFFQDVKKNSWNEIESVKIHDLMHDIALSVSRKEIYTTSTISGKLDKKVRHFGYLGGYGRYSSGKTHIRSYILCDYSRRAWINLEYSFCVKTLATSCRRLRALELVGSEIKTLPEFIGKLLHLRYLDLTCNVKLEVLPKSITKLCNLETLTLDLCRNLKELPKDFNKLVKLRALDISFCYRLDCMPSGMDKLTCLCRLSDFIVGSKSSSSWKQCFDGLEELKALENLRGHLDISLMFPNENVGEEDGLKRGLYLSNKVHLNHVGIHFEKGVTMLGDEGSIALMEDLQTHPNLKSLAVREYYGTRIPDWVFLLPNLVELVLYDCKEMEYLTNFGSAEQVPFLPSLEVLTLQCMPKLKGWRRVIEGVRDYHLSKLKTLIIFCTPELTWIPSCPKLESLDLYKFNNRMVLGDGVTSSSCEEVVNSSHNLKKININDATWLNSMPMEDYQCLERLVIHKDNKLKNLGVIREVFRNCSSLRYLEIFNCQKLSVVVVAGGLEHLTALEELVFCECDNLSLLEEEKEGNKVTPCPPLLPSLRTLRLNTISKLEYFPNWMQFLSGLYTLDITSCLELKAMPNWMSKLTSLRKLCVFGCSKSLEKRCQKDPPGEDWPLIQHIPSTMFLAFPDADVDISLF